MPLDQVLVSAKPAIPVEENVPAPVREELKIVQEILMERVGTGRQRGVIRRIINQHRTPAPRLTAKSLFERLYRAQPRY